MQTGDTFALQFYDNSIFPGTKIDIDDSNVDQGFTITQFFQVLKYQIAIYTNYYNIFIPHL